MHLSDFCQCVSPNFIENYSDFLHTALIVPVESKALVMRLLWKIDLTDCFLKVIRAINDIQ